MPVNHFTLRGYGTWLPDHPRGFYSRTLGWQRPDPTLGEVFASRMVHDATTFSYRNQRTAIQALLNAQAEYRWTLYAMVGSRTHFHAIVGWRDDRVPVTVGSAVKAAMSKDLNIHGRREHWFVKGSGRGEVRNNKHLAHLITVYLPSHRGWMWQRGRGWRFSRPEIRKSDANR